VEFDGTGISVFELKRDIIIKSGLGDGTDFDLAIYNEDGNEGKHHFSRDWKYDILTGQNMMTILLSSHGQPLLLLDDYPPSSPEQEELQDTCQERCQ
jgi:hypothetical protein